MGTRHCCEFLRGFLFALCQHRITDAADRTCDGYDIIKVRFVRIIVCAANDHIKSGWRYWRFLHINDKNAPAFLLQRTRRRCAAASDKHIRFRQHLCHKKRCYCWQCFMKGGIACVIFRYFGFGICIFGDGRNGIGKSSRLPPHSDNIGRISAYLHNGILTCFCHSRPGGNSSGRNAPVLSRWRLFKSLVQLFLADRLD